MWKKKELPADAPVWLTEEGKISEPIFCSDFLARHPMKCIHGCFFTCHACGGKLRGRFPEKWMVR